MQATEFPPVKSNPYLWPYNGRWSSDDTILFFIDVASKIPEHDPLSDGAKGLQERLLPLVEVANSVQMPIVQSTHPWFLPGECEPVATQYQYWLPLAHSSSVLDATPVRPRGMSAFFGTTLHESLNRMGIRNIIFAGIPTETSVHSTMRDANDRGFECLLLEDGCVGSTADEHRAIIRITRFGNGLFGATASIEEVVFAMEASK